MDPVLPWLTQDLKSLTAAEKKKVFKVKERIVKSGSVTWVFPELLLIYK